MFSLSEPPSRGKVLTVECELATPRRGSGAVCVTTSAYNTHVHELVRAHLSTFIVIFCDHKSTQVSTSLSCLPHK